MKNNLTPNPSLSFIRRADQRPTVAELIKRTSIGFFALVTLLSLFCTTTFAQEFELKASLYGYNLLWPSKRCCEFDLTVSADGAGTVVVRGGSERPETRTQAIRLSNAQMQSLRKVVEQVRFFSIPSEICCGPVDGDQRQVTVRIGKSEHQVQFGESARGKNEELERARKLWTEIRGTFSIVGENVY